jgi:hypothetical protein
MKNLVTKAGVAAIGSVLLLSTAGAKSADALFIKATETFSVSEDVPGSVVYDPYGYLNTSPNDRQFRSYDNNGSDIGGRYYQNDSDINALAGYDGSDAGEPDNQGGDVTDMAIVGSFTAEEIRGLVEFDLAYYYSEFAKLDAWANTIPEGTVGDDLTEAQAEATKTKLINSSIMNFRVFQLGGLHYDNQYSLDLFGIFEGNVDVSYYQGDGIEDVADYGNGTSKATGDPIVGTPSTALGSFSTRDFKKGQRVTFDISAAVADALTNGWQTLGLRLQADPSTTAVNPLGKCQSPSCNATTFDKFTIGAVPTPAAILPTLFGMGMAAIRKKKSTDSDLTEA